MKELDFTTLRKAEISDIKITRNNNEKQSNIIFKLVEIFINSIKQNFISIISSIFITIINTYGIYHYLLSLNGCKNSRANCLRHYSLVLMYQLFFEVLRAGISFSIICVMAFWRLTHFSNLFLILSLYFTIYAYDHGETFSNHGYYNFYGFNIVISIFIPLFLYLSYVAKLIYQKLFKRLLYVLTPVLFFLFICYLRYLFLSRCSGYHIGLNGVKIDDNPDKYSCFYDYPKNCSIDLLSPFMDYSRIGGDCKTIRDLKEQKKYFTYFLIPEKKYKNTTRLGFPITTTNEFSLRTQYNIKHFNERVSKNVIDMDKYDKIPKGKKKPLKPEVILEFNKDNIGEIKIEINKNETLEKERKELGKKYKSKFDNVIFIFMDAFIREHFKRKMKKKTKFIE